MAWAREMKKNASFCQGGDLSVTWTLQRSLKVARFLRLTRAFRDNCKIIVYILELYSVQIIFFLFSTNSFVVFDVADALISLILKFYSLSRFNFLIYLQIALI